MKNIWNKLISMVLVITLLVTGTSPALAAPTRAPAKVNYLSEVAIIEAAGDEEAQKILAGIAEAHSSSQSALIIAGAAAHAEGDHALILVPDIYGSVELFISGGNLVR